MNVNTSVRLHEAIAAVCPIVGVAIIDTVAHTTRIDFSASATAGQKTAANNVVAAFDWSDAADTTYAAQKEAALASSSIDRGVTSSGIEEDRLIVALALVTLDEINILRNALSLAPRTQAQLLNAVKAKISTLPT